MKKYLLIVMLMLCLCFAACEPGWGEPENQPEVCPPENTQEAEEELAEKPVIYLYPEEETEVTVTLDIAGAMTCAYPEYGDGWRVTATPDGRLRDEAGREYNYLFWEGDLTMEPDMSRGFVVAGADTGAFLEEALKTLGLTDREADDFITYWLPRMQRNPYNLISFQGEAYTASAEIAVTPQPDSLIRVFMVFEGLEEPIEIPGQVLSAPERTGFTAVEWGGMELTE